MKQRNDDYRLFPAVRSARCQGLGRGKLQPPAHSTAMPAPSPKQTRYLPFLHEGCSYRSGGKLSFAACARRLSLQYRRGHSAMHLGRPSLDSVAAKVSVSRNRIGQIQKGAMEHIRFKLTQRGFELADLTRIGRRYYLLRTCPYQHAAIAERKPRDPPARWITSRRNASLRSRFPRT